MPSSPPEPRTRRPPRDITPREFFESWLPAEYAVHAVGRRMPRLDLRYRLVGDAGEAGTWDLAVGGPTVVVKHASASDTEPVVTITQSVRDWRALACGEEGGFDLAPPRGGPLDLLFVDPELRRLVEVVRGVVRFEVPGYVGRTWQALLQLGASPSSVEPDASPDACIAIDAPTYALILAGQLAPAEAWLTGRALVTGDATLAMQVAMALLPRFT